MVAYEASKRKTLTDSFSGKYLFLGLIFCLAATTILVVLSIISGLNAPKPCSEPEEEPTPVLPEPEPEPDYLLCMRAIDASKMELGILTLRSDTLEILS